MRDYYCSQKFTWLKLDAEKKVIQSCCKSAQENIDIKYLSDNPGSLFNSPKLLQERQDMLENKRVASCENACWKAEDQGIWSRRTETNSNIKTHTAIRNNPTVLDLTLSGECNLTCSYCCKNYSSSWRNDIQKNGDYKKLTSYGDRYSLNTFDKIIKKVSQKKRQNLKIFQLVEKEIDYMKDSLTRITISGGEPFLDHRFSEIIKKFSSITEINVFTGLGISEKILRKGLETIALNKNVILNISAESTDDNFEFNRYGNNWKTFLRYLKIIEEYNVKTKFQMSYGNLNVMDFVKFNNYFSNYDRELTIIYEPAFLCPYNLDDETKENIIQEIKNSNLGNTDNAITVINSLKIPTSSSLRAQLEYFVKEFANRRGLKINFMPKTLKKWLNLD